MHNFARACLSSFRSLLFRPSLLLFSPTLSPSVPLSHSPSPVGNSRSAVSFSAVAQLTTSSLPILLPFQSPISTIWPLCKSSTSRRTSSIYSRCSFLTYPHVKPVQFAGYDTVPSSSPYCIKVEAFCRANNLKFEVCLNIFSSLGAKLQRRNTKVRGANGLLPFIELNGVQTCDSESIFKRLIDQFHLQVSLPLIIAFPPLPFLLL